MFDGHRRLLSNWLLLLGFCNSCQSGLFCLLRLPFHLLVEAFLLIESDFTVNCLDKPAVEHDSSTASLNLRYRTFRLVKYRGDELAPAFP